jgi:hypothetical protein
VLPYYSGILSLVLQRYIAVSRTASLVSSYYYSNYLLLQLLKSHSEQQCVVCRAFFFFKVSWPNPFTGQFGVRKKGGLPGAPRYGTATVGKLGTIMVEERVLLRSNVGTECCQVRGGA